MTPCNEEKAPALIDQETGLQLGAVPFKGGVLTYHYDREASRIVGTWLDGRPIAQMPDVRAMVQADLEGRINAMFSGAGAEGEKAATICWRTG